MNAEQKIKDDYIVNVGDQAFKFLNVKMEKTLLGKWAISYEMIQKMYLSVALEILEKRNERLTFDQFEFLAKLSKKSMADVGKILEKDRSTIAKWKKNQVLIPFPESFTLKTILLENLFKEFGTFQTREAKIELRKKAHLPEPIAA